MTNAIDFVRTMCYNLVTLRAELDYRFCRITGDIEYDTIYECCKIL